MTSTVERPSIIQLLDYAWFRVHAQAETTTGPAARELALAKTHIEDAMMRVNRGFALLAGVAQTSDVEALLRERQTETEKPKSKPKRKAKK